MNFCPMKFIQEFSDRDSEPCPAKTLYQIMCSLKRHLEENGGVGANMYVERY
jgi:hypothetical protein